MTNKPDLHKLFGVPKDTQNSYTFAADQQSQGGTAPSGELLHQVRMQMARMYNKVEGAIEEYLNDLPANLEIKCGCGDANCVHCSAWQHVRTGLYMYMGLRPDHTEDEFLATLGEVPFGYDLENFEEEYRLSQGNPPTSNTE